MRKVQAWVFKRGERMSAFQVVCFIFVLVLIICFGAGLITFLIPILVDLSQEVSNIIIEKIDEKRSKE